jgi:hypothetical protein
VSNGVREEGEDGKGGFGAVIEAVIEAIRKGKHVRGQSLSSEGVQCFGDGLHTCGVRTKYFVQRSP